MVTYQNFGINVSIEGLPDYNYTKCDTRFLKIRYPEFVSHYLSDINLPKFTNVITLVLDFSKKGKWDIKNLRNHFDGLKQLEGLKSFELSSDLWGNVRVKRIHFLRDLILAMPKTIHSLKLHKIAADTYGQAIADAFPSLKEFQIFSDESWSSIRSYYSEDAINPEEDNDLQQEDIEGELLQLNLEDEQQVDIDQRDIVDPDVEHNLGDQVIAEDDIERKSKIYSFR
uniref:CRAL-TRIO domain-containing protein n=1 Tax=Rhabditophanes sp. KR3021 TaxID=114890 RepID=A0AC35TSE8_9BILA